MKPAAFTEEQVLALAQHAYLDGEASFPGSKV